MKIGTEQIQEIINGYEAKLAALKAENTKLKVFREDDQRLIKSLDEQNTKLIDFNQQCEAENERLKEEAKGINNLLEALIKLQAEKAELLEALERWTDGEDMTILRDTKLLLSKHK